MPNFPTTRPSTPRPAPNARPRLGSLLAAGLGLLLAAACAPPPGDGDSAETSTSSNTQAVVSCPVPAVNTGSVCDLGNGSIKFQVTLPGAQAYVQVFSRQNGVHNVSTAITNTGVSNGNGTSTYSLTRPGYLVGDLVEHRYYSFPPGGVSVFTPGPDDAVWYSLTYGFSFSVQARATTATLSWNGAIAPAFHVYRTSAGDTRRFPRRIHAGHFEDDHLALGKTYSYEVVPLTAAMTERGHGPIVTVTTRSSTDKLVKIPRLDFLVPIYRGGSTPMSNAAVAQAKAGIELARAFYLRNSKGRLHLDISYVEIDAEAPSTEGPTMANIEADLRARGVLDDEYDMIYPVDDSIRGCWGGFQLLGRTAGSFGWECGVDYPLVDANVNTTLTWSFTHEFQHALDGVIAAGSGHPELIYGHPDSVYFPGYNGPIIDAGEHFDWEAATLRAFTAYDAFVSPWDGYVESDDGDKDGFADADSRLAADEARFGSAKTSADSDGDGLADLAEFYVGTFAGSNPKAADSDGDGLRDNVDPSPRAPLPKELRRSASITLDGNRDSGYTLYRKNFDFSAVSGFQATTWLTYGNGFVYVYAEMNRPATLLVYLDGSGQNGFWQGGNTYGVSIKPNQSQPFINLDSRNNEISPGDAIAGGTVVTKVVNGLTIVEAKIPANLGPGFGFTGEVSPGIPTSAGSIWGLRLVFSGIGAPGAGVFSLPRAYQNELYRFDDLKLAN